jgi:hypothetical protein
VLICQGWCSALSVPIDTPFFLQELLLAGTDDKENHFRHMASFVKILVRNGITETDRRFHNDVMNGEGDWWLDDEEEVPDFKYLWKRIWKKMQKVSNYSRIKHGCQKI